MLEGRHNDFRIRIYPQMNPNYWGNPILMEILKLSGFFHCRFTCVSRKREPYSFIYGYFNAVTKNRSLDQLALMTGTKFQKVAYVKGTTNSDDLRNALNSTIHVK